MHKKLQYLMFIIFALTISVLIGRSFRTGEIPNGFINSCENCHFNPAGGGPRNPFGKEIENNFLSQPGSAGHVVWGPELAALDSDGDGVSNGEELQDPNGEWKQGDPAPGNPDLVTNPGIPDASSVDDETPLKFELAQNYPNPFSKGNGGSSTTTMRFSIPTAGNVVLTVFDALGNKVADLANNNFSAGSHQVIFNASNLSSGIYFYSIQTNGFSQTKKMLLLR